MCGINAVGAQGCGCMFTFCHAYLKMGVLLHKMAIVCNQKFMAVHYGWVVEFSIGGRSQITFTDFRSFLTPPPPLVYT